MQERRVGKKTRKKGWKKVILRPVNKEEMQIIQCWECGQGIDKYNSWTNQYKIKYTRIADLDMITLELIVKTGTKGKLLNCTLKCEKAKF
jgi:hypothetical protein